VLGVADTRLLEAAIDAVAEGDAARALGVLAECAEQGRDAAAFAGDLEARARELLVTQTLGEVPAELSLTPEADAALHAQAERLPTAVVVGLLEALGGAMEAVRAGADARTRLELALVKIAKPEVDASMKALLARIERLEGGGQVAVAAAPASQPPAATAPAEPPPTEDPPVDRPSEPEPPPAAQAVEISVASIAAAPEPAAPAPAAVAEAAVPEAVAPPGPAASSGSMALSGSAPVAPLAEPPAAPQAAASGAAQAIAEDLAPVLAWWPAVVELVRTDNALLGACIEEARPVEVTGEDLVVAFSATAPFLKKKAENPDNRAAVAAALHDVTGRRWRLSYELKDGIDGEQEEALSEEQWLARFMEEFDAEELPSEEPVMSEEKGA
jgi:DNA polymerase-3 subunit gamma/tau